MSSHTYDTHLSYAHMHNRIILMHVVHARGWGRDGIFTNLDHRIKMPQVLGYYLLHNFLSTNHTVFRGPLL